MGPIRDIFCCFIGRTCIAQPTDGVPASAVLPSLDCQCDSRSVLQARSSASILETKLPMARKTALMAVLARLVCVERLVHHSISERVYKALYMHTGDATAGGANAGVIPVAILITAANAPAKPGDRRQEEALPPLHENVVRQFSSAEGSVEELLALVSSTQSTWASTKPVLPNASPVPAPSSWSVPSRLHRLDRCSDECRDNARQAIAEAVAALAGPCGGAPEDVTVRITVSEWCDGGTLHTHLLRMQLQSQRSRRPVPVGYLPQPSHNTHVFPPAASAPCGVIGTQGLARCASHALLPRALAVSSQGDGDTGTLGWSPGAQQPSQPPLRRAGSTASLYDTGHPFREAAIVQPHCKSPSPSYDPSAGAAEVQLAAVEAALDVARGLAALHSAGLMHGHLGPGAVMCCSRTQAGATGGAQTAGCGCASAGAGITATTAERRECGCEGGDCPNAALYTVRASTGDAASGVCGLCLPGNSGSAPGPSNRAPQRLPTAPCDEHPPSSAGLMQGLTQSLSGAIAGLVRATSNLASSMQIPPAGSSAPAAAATIASATTRAGYPPRPLLVPYTTFGLFPKATPWSTQQQTSAAKPLRLHQAPATPVAGGTDTFLQSSTSAASASVAAMTSGANGCLFTTTTATITATTATGMACFFDGTGSGTVTGLSLGTGTGIAMQLPSACRFEHKADCGPVGPATTNGFLAGPCETEDRGLNGLILAHSAAVAGDAGPSAPRCSEPQTQIQHSALTQPPRRPEAHMLCKLRLPTTFPSGTAVTGGGTGAGAAPGMAAVPTAREVNLSHNTAKWRTLAYAAPELFTGLASSNSSSDAKNTGAASTSMTTTTAAVGPAADVFSFGALLWQLCSGGRPPHYERHPAQILMGLLTGDLDLDLDWPYDTDPKVADLGRACLRRNPSERPTAEQVCERLEAAVPRLRSAAAHAVSGAKDKYRVVRSVTLSEL